MLKHACWLSFVAMYLSIYTPMANADSLTIRFKELVEYAQSKSIGASVINRTLELAKTDRDIALQPSNPELALDRQDVEGNREKQFTLGKNFEMPWIRWKRRSAWSDQLKSAELGANAKRAELLAELRAGYVSLQFFDLLSSRLTQLQAAITDAARDASHRRTEGHLSGVEEHLIQMMVTSLQAQHQAVLQERNEMNYRWRALIGIPADHDLSLVTRIEFRQITLDSVHTYRQRFEERPAYLSRLARQQSLGKHAAAERAKFLPSLNVYGGYKEIETDNSGYVFGLSLSLPLLNMNRAAARKFEIERRIALDETTRFKAELFGRIELLVAAVQESQGVLPHSAAHFGEDANSLDDLLYSYEEGWLTLSEMLNAVQIEVSGLRDFYEHLIRYYRNIFELEAITGTTLVMFD